MVYVVHHLPEMRKEIREKLCGDYLRNHLSLRNNPWYKIIIAYL